MRGRELTIASHAAVRGSCRHRSISKRITAPTLYRVNTDHNLLKETAYLTTVLETSVDIVFASASVHTHLNSLLSRILTLRQCSPARAFSVATHADIPVNTRVDGGSGWSSADDGSVEATRVSEKGDVRTACITANSVATADFVVVTCK